MVRKSIREFLELSQINNVFSKKNCIYFKDNSEYKTYFDFIV